MSETKTPGEKIFVGLYVCTDPRNAGKNFKLFQTFLSGFYSSALSRGEIIFTCPEVEELKKEILAMKIKSQKLVEALDFYMATSVCSEKARKALKEWRENK